MHAHSFDGYVIEQIAKTLRRGEYNYVSLESILSEYGLISQIPIDSLILINIVAKINISLFINMGGKISWKPLNLRQK